MITVAYVTYRGQGGYRACYLPSWLWDDLRGSFCYLSWAYSLQTPASILSYPFTLRTLVSMGPGWACSTKLLSEWRLPVGGSIRGRFLCSQAMDTSLLGLNLHRLLTNLQGTSFQAHHEFKLRGSVWNPPFGIQCLLLSHPLSFPHLLLTLSENKQTNKQKQKWSCNP